jgi:hypothetical protein
MVARNSHLFFECVERLELGEIGKVHGRLL